MTSLNETPPVKNTSSLVVPNLKSKSDELEQYIQELNGMIETLNQELPSSSPERRENITQTIQMIEPIRTNLINTLNGMYSYYTQNVDSANNVMQQQKQAMDIINRELALSKKKLEYIQEQKINKIRLIEINDYYSEEYAEYTKLVKYIIYMLLPIILLTIIGKMEIVPSNLLGLFIIIILLVGVYFISPVIFSILSRDTMNYNEYRWRFDKSTAPKVDIGEASKGDMFAYANNGGEAVCVGEQCCSDGFRYNASLNKCEMPSMSSSLFSINLNSNKN